MPKYLVRYSRGEREFETTIEINALTRNQAMIKLQENMGMYKDLSFSDVKVLDVQKADR